MRKISGIRVTRVAVLAGLASLAMVLSSCGRFSRMYSKPAILAAIEAHLKQRPGLALSSMSTEIQDVKFDGDKATAEVTFQSKQVPQLKVEVRYMLHREGDHWEVESSTPVGGMGTNPHGAAEDPSANSGKGQGVPGNAPGVPMPQASH